MSDTSAVTHIRYILACVLLALGFNVTDAILDPIGSLTREVKEVRAKLDKIDTLDDRLKSIEAVVYAKAVPG